MTKEEVFAREKQSIAIVLDEWKNYILNAQSVEDLENKLDKLKNDIPQLISHSLNRLTDLRKYIDYKDMFEPESKDGETV